MDRKLHSFSILHSCRREAVEISIAKVVLVWSTAVEMCEVKSYNAALEIL